MFMMEWNIFDKSKLLQLLWISVNAFVFHKVEGAPSVSLVVVFENDYTVAKDVIDNVLDYYIEQEILDVDIQYSSVVIEDGFSESLVCERIVSSNPTIVIDTIRKPRIIGNRAGALVKKVVRRLGIPTVSATYGKMEEIMGWEDLDEMEQQYLVQIAPPGYIFPHVVRDIVSHQNLTTTGVLFDESIELDQMSSTLMKNIATRATIHTIRPERPKIEEYILKMRNSGTVNFFVIGPSSTISHVLETANAVNMTGPEFSWYLVSLDPEQPHCNCKMFNAIWMSPLPSNANEEKVEKLSTMFSKTSSEVEIAFYYDLVMLVAQAVKNKIMDGDWPSQLSYPSCTSEEKINTNERNMVGFINALKQEADKGMFGPFKIAEVGGNYQELKLSILLIKFRNNAISNPNRIGVWTYRQPTGKIMFEPGQDLKNFTVITVYRVTTLEIPPFIYKMEDENGTVSFSGYCIELLEAIKQLLNFEYTIFETEDKKFGAMNDKSEWNGMMRDLVEKKADIALGPIAAMAEREAFVDFTVPYYDLVGISIIMKKPKIPSSLFKFLTVLEVNVWTCILASYFITSFLLFVFDRLSPYSFYNNKEKFREDAEEEKRDFSLKESLWFCITSLTPQGGGEAPRSLSGRLVAATWWLFGFIIVASYTANLAAFLTVSRLESPIESIDDLAKQHKIKYAPQEDTSAATYFERMAYIEGKFYEVWKNMSLDDSLNEIERAKLAVWDYPVSDKYTKMWWTMKEIGLPKTFDEGIEKVLNSKGPQEGFAFIADGTRVKYAIMTNCDLISVGREFSRKPLALAVQQGSPLKEEISRAILKLLNQRKLKGFKERWWTNNPNRVKCDDSDSQNDGISIENIGGVFIIIFMGVSLAVLTLIIEYFLFRNKKQRNARVVSIEKFPNDTSTNQ